MARIRAAEIAVMAGIPTMLTYKVPDGITVVTGARVVVPVRKTERIGVVVSVREEEETAGLKPIGKVLDENPLIPQELLDLLLWTSRYYHSSPGATVSLAFPPYLRQARTAAFPEDMKIVRTGTGKGVIGRNQHEILEAVPEQGLSLERFREMFPGNSSSLKSLIARGFLEQKTCLPEQISVLSPKAPPVTYTGEQLSAIREISDAIEGNRFKPYLLHGITGSGKTEVYLACAMKALQTGRSVLYLVPEIALTPQTISMIQKRIPCEMALFHSGLPPAARAREFMKASRSKVSFVLGTRSAIFSPLKNLGLIVVDEEHDHSYKQEDGIPYNARDLSILRAKNNQTVVILGSATPSMDTFSRISGKHVHLITMTSRAGSGALPAIDIIDMKGVSSPVSDQLFDAMRTTLSKNEQALLFINRRGFSAALICPGCGIALKCIRCDRSLTYHRAKGLGLCHYCGYSMHLPEICPKCGCLDMRQIGMGTEKILHTVKELFSEARILRMDSDEITTTRKLGAALDSIRNHEVDIIVGTQMIAKGHDFPDLTLVGVMHAEQLLFMPDFRAGERTFQQVVQVAGRAGRRAADTKVLIQTLLPDHPLIQSIAEYDYGWMISSEAEVRKATGFPPFTHMARCIFSSANNDLAMNAISEAAKAMNIQDVTLMGPAPAPISLLRNTYRWHMILTSRNRGKLHAALDRLERMKIPSGIRVKIDVDPYTML